MQGEGYLWETKRKGTSSKIELNFKKLTADSKSALVESVKQESQKQGLPRGSKVTADIVSGALSNMDKTESTADIDSAGADIVSEGVRTSSPTGADTMSDDTVLSINNNIRLKVYKLKEDWKPDTSIVYESAELVEVPVEFIEQQTQTWLAYRTAPVRISSERTHLIWHQTFAAHVLHHWKIHAKKNSIKTPDFKKNGFDSPEAYENAKNEHGRMKTDRFMYENLKKSNQEIPEYLRHFDKQRLEVSA
jgi:hypothetical protein